MKTITNTTGTKAVNITENSFNGFVCCFVQIYGNESDLIELRTFNTEKKAIGYANKKLS